jgi:hypothetical protein
MLDMCVYICPVDFVNCGRKIVVGLMWKLL